MNRPASTARPSPARTPTLQAIADAVGVHRATAARALDPAKRHLISAEVVERVQKEAQRLGYRRDVMAASLRTGRSRLVGVLFPDLANPVFAPILGGIGSALSAHGYSVLVADGGSDEKQQIETVEQLLARRVDGLVLATATRRDAVVTACLKAKIPTVLVNRAEDKERVPAVVTDDISGMRLSVQHLIELGHRRIGHIAGPENLSTGVLRRRGFEAAMAEAGLDGSMVVTAQAYSRSAGRQASATLLDTYPVTAIAASNDLLALGAYLELRTRGLSCPEDVSVVGHNDMPLVDMVDPPLTTVHIEQVTMGEEAARLLLERMEADAPTPVVTKVTPPVLVTRASTCAPAAVEGQMKRRRAHAARAR